jgi:hypothetical protein
MEQRRVLLWRRINAQADLVHKILAASVAETKKHWISYCPEECLFHLSFADIHAAISNFKASGSTYLLASHFPRIGRNVDTVTGGCRALNWTLAPFHFPDPVTTVDENLSDRYLALWRLDDIKTELFDCKL